MAADCITANPLNVQDFGEGAYGVELRHQFIQWLRDNDSWPTGVFATELALVDMPLVRVHYLVRSGEPPRNQIDRETGEIAKAARDYPVKISLPDWWQPKIRAEIGL